jgi:hypothetical protein
VSVQCNEALALLGYFRPPPSRGIRILSIDGGGMRGFIALEALKASLEYRPRRFRTNGFFSYVRSLAFSKLVHAMYLGR